MKIKKDQLKEIQEQQKKLNDLLNRIGILEANKHGLLHEMAGLNQDIEEFKKLLEEEYGAININVEDGSYTKINELNAGSGGEAEIEAAVAHDK
jgi:hypothetical protein